MNAGKTIDFFTKAAEEDTSKGKAVPAPKTDQTIETKTDHTEKVESDKPGHDGKPVESVVADAEPQEEKVAAVTAKDVANMLSSLAKNPTNTGVAAGVGLGSILAALGTISRSNDPKKKKSVMTNPALLGTLGAGAGYLGGNYLENITPQDINASKERVLQTVNNGLAYLNDKADKVFSYEGLKSLKNKLPGDTRSDASNIAGNLTGIGKKFVKSTLGKDLLAGALGYTGMRSLGRELVKQDRLDQLKLTNPKVYEKVKNLVKATGSIDDAFRESAKDPRLGSLVDKIKFRDAAKALLNPWSREGRPWLQQLSRAVGVHGNLGNSKAFNDTLRKIVELKRKLQPTAGGSINIGTSSEDIKELARLRQLATSGKMKSLNAGTKAMRMLGRVINPSKALKGKAALLSALYAAYHFGKDPAKGLVKKIDNGLGISDLGRKALKGLESVNGRLADIARSNGTVAM